MKAAASATKQGEHRNREKKRNPPFISNFGVCENHNLGFGPCFPTQSKRDRWAPAGIEQLSAICDELGEVPIVAIGGITAANIGEVARAGAAATELAMRFFVAAHHQP
jgi:hypothetical protein